MASTLIVFARQPELGRVKTRLGQRLGDEAALRLYRAFLDDACALAAQVAERRVLQVAGDPSSLKELAEKHAMTLAAQEGSDLGARMHHALSAHVADGPTCIIGSDSPSLPRALVDEAFERLDAGCEVALGPAGDGGYWLIGATRPVPELFESMEWGTRAVLPETLRRLDGTHLALLPFWYDVDELEDLALLASHLLHLPDEVAPATRAELQRLSTSVELG